MNKPKIFLSYSNPDRDWANALAMALKDQGARVWLDMEQVRLGDSMADVIEKGLRESDWIVFLLHPDVSLTPNVLFEMGAAVGMGKHILPVIPSGAETSKLPHPLRIRKGLIRGPVDKTAKQILAAVHATPGDKDF